MIGVLDVGLGNILSVCRMVERAGASPIRICSREDLKAVNKVIIPGVGPFDEGVRRLIISGLFEELKIFSAISTNKILGICLGMQLLCNGSEEGQVEGLGLVPAYAKKFSFPGNDKRKVPHMGWNVVKPRGLESLVESFGEELRYYFVHSYYVVPEDSKIITGETEYGSMFCSAFQKDNLIGVQFHPEKSHRFGLALMKKFAGL